MRILTARLTVKTSEIKKKIKNRIHLAFFVYVAILLTVYWTFRGFWAGKWYDYIAFVIGVAFLYGGYVCKNFQLGAYSEEGAKNVRSL
jgi:hypothetical protein